MNWLTLLKYLEVEKEFFVSCSILIVLVGILFVLTRAYISFREKQKECDGKFNLQDERILNIGKIAEKSDEKSEEALTIVKRVEICTDKMQETVKDIKDGYRDYIEDKYKNGTKEKEIIEPN